MCIFVHIHLFEITTFFFFHFQNAATPASLITCSSCCVLWSNSLPNTNFFTQFTLPPLPDLPSIHLFQPECSLACSIPAAPPEGSGASVIYKSLIFHPVSLSSYIKYKHNQSRAVPSSLWTAQPHWQVCLWLWLRLNQPNRASWNAFHKRKHFCNLGQNINKWCWEL